MHPIRVNIASANVRREGAVWHAMQ